MQKYWTQQAGTLLSKPSRAFGVHTSEASCVWVQPPSTRNRKSGRFFIKRGPHLSSVVEPCYVSCQVMATAMRITHRLRQMLFTMNSDLLLWKSLIAVCLLSNLEAPEPTFHFKGVTSPTLLGDQSCLSCLLSLCRQTRLTSLGRENLSLVHGAI